MPLILICYHMDHSGLFPLLTCQPHSPGSHHPPLLFLTCSVLVQMECSQNRYPDPTEMTASSRGEPCSQHRWSARLWCRSRQSFPGWLRSAPCPHPLTPVIQGDPPFPACPPSWDLLNIVPTQYSLPPRQVVPTVPWVYGYQIANFVHMRNLFTLVYFINKPPKFSCFLCLVSSLLLTVSSCGLLTILCLACVCVLIGENCLCS